jgi:transposase
MDCHQTDAAQQIARRAAGERPSYPQRHLLVLRSGVPWRDLPNNFGPYATCYNRFVPWRRAGVWAKTMISPADAHDPAVQMNETSIVRVHQHTAYIARNKRQSIRRSRGGLTSKIHASVGTNGLAVRLALTPREAHDNRFAGRLLSRHKSKTMLLADRGYDAGRLGQHSNTAQPDRADLLERFFITIKQSRRGATRYDDLRRTTSPSSSLLASGYGYASMSPCPSASERATN